MRDKQQDVKGAHVPVYEAATGCEYCSKPLDRTPASKGPAPHLCSRCASPEGRAARHAVKAGEQLGIPFPKTPLRPLNRRGRTIAERYVAWRATPHGRRVYELFTKYAYEALEAGVNHYSHKDIVSRVRWRERIETRSPDDFKINDHYTSRLARELAKEDDRFTELFEFRNLRSP